MPLSISLSELPLRPSTLALLTQRGYISSLELEESRRQGGISNLAAELDVDVQQAAALLKEVQECLSSQQQNGTPSISACDLLEKLANSHRNHIVTFAKDVDHLLGGGIALGHLTEIAGLPGTGKTQMAMQLAVLARLPMIFGGVEGRCLYIDSEGSFSPERCWQMSHALIKHCKNTCKRRNLTFESQLNEEKLLESIQVFRVHDETCQTATLNNLSTYLNTKNGGDLPVKLIVVDSIAFHYRAITPTNSKYYLERTKQLTSLATHLSTLARTHHLAVVCINQMTTKFNNSTTGTSTSSVPALGESWAHAVTTRLLLSQEGNSNDHRMCTLAKSPHRPFGKAPFQVLAQGIRGTPNEASSSSAFTPPNSLPTVTPNHNKRLRTS